MISFKRLSHAAISLAGTIVLSFFYSPPVRGNTVQVLYNGEVTSENIERTVDGGANWFTTSTGLFSMNRTGGDYNGFQVTGFYSFCIEPREFVTPGTTYVYTWDVLQNGTTNIGGMGVAKANLLRELFGRYYPVIGVPLDAQHASAMQISIWEIVREDSGTLDVNNGTTRFRNPQDAPALALAQTYVQSLTGTGPMVNTLNALTLVGNQDVVVQDPALVPEPPYMMMVGLLLVGKSLWLRRLHFRNSR